ncbi:SET and MYND domain-containing protein 5-like [Lingula anatina]|uniref:SET and MYND domain-containing protein 5-like n=1 Tax=Lingula anatina TaxID=7574 RepID=A0A1S3K7T4_LINAN|nr:SET and MYND domain-containing protein 5-like [Lingula anatina]|eukprot:XP_013418557.1 SET and MYND domain-containing protein 5-like [Lingula anatina]
MADGSETAELEEQSYDALSLCNQNPYPGDKELLDQEKQTLSRNGWNIAPCVQRAKTIDLTMAGAKLVLAMKLLEKGNAQQALECCTTALQLGADCWQLRSECHLALGQYSLAYRDCLMAKQKHNTPQVWKLGGKILQELGLPVMAEFWLRKATQASQGQDREASMLFQQVRVKRLYDPLTVNHPIEVTFSEYGRAVLAKENIEPGQLIWSESPLTSAQTMYTLDVPACSHCGRSLLTAETFFGHLMLDINPVAEDLIERYWPKLNPVQCKRCKRETYCSQACLADAWYQHHQVLCPSINKAAGELYDFCDKRELCTKGYWSAAFSPMALARIWGAVIAEVRRLVKKESTEGPTVEQWAAAKAPFRRFISYGITGHAQWASNMVQLMDRIFNNFDDGINYHIDDTEFEGRFYQVACNCQSFSDGNSPYIRFMQGISQDPTQDYIKPYLNDRGIPKEAIFGGLFPVHACFNHSCDNSVEVMDANDENGRPGLVIRAKKGAKQGTEIFTTYIDTQLPKSERRAWLFRAYNFWCQCPRCQFEGENANVCTNCGTKAEDSKDFPKCSKCKRAWYCSQKCQKEAWKKGHKKICQVVHSDTTSPLNEPMEKHMRKLSDMLQQGMALTAE